MKVNIFTRSANDPRFEVMLRKFGEGVKACGEEVEFVTGLNYKECDVAVIFGSWKDRPHDHHVIKRDVVKRAKNFIVVETPIIGRGPVSNVMQDDWYRVGLNGFLADDGEFNNQDCDDARWKIFQHQRGIELKPYHSGEHIVIALQVPGDASMRGTSTERWAYESCLEIRKYTDMPIYVRFPQVPKEWNPVLLDAIANLDTQKVYFQTGTKENLIPTLDKAHCTVCFSSTMSVDSLINGCPTIAMSPANFAYDIASNKLSEIVDPKRPPREQWIHNLAYTTWFINEIQQGLPWLHLKEKLK